MSADSTNSRPVLDHVVILVSETVLATLPDRLKDYFTVVTGGEHTGGQTFNKLIIFQDGSYIELIAFFDRVAPEDRKTHRWGSSKENTIVDWAFTLPDEANFVHVQKRVAEAKGGITYDDPWNMGRKRPDGVELKWSIGASRQADGNPPPPGTVPFWCLDQTERKLRVPYQDNPETKQPAGILGISGVRISVPEAKYEDVKKVYAGILDGKNHTVTENSWEAVVPTLLASGAPVITVDSSPDDRKIAIKLAGSANSPKTIEVLPGLVLDVKA